MINRIKIKNFKSIQDEDLRLGNINLITGINGSGKSTFLQTLLLLRQSFLFRGFFQTKETLILGHRESLINLGNFKDILCYQTKKGEEYIELSIEFDTSEFKYKSIEYSSDNRDKSTIEGSINHPINSFIKESLFSERCQYLAAERIEPEEDYPRFNGDEKIGKRGQFAPHFLAEYGSTEIPIKALSLKERPDSYSLINQVTDWLGEISDSIKVQVNENLKSNRIELSYFYQYQDGTPSQNHKPQNVGYGITHTLPIIVAILSAKPGDLIIIENPETQLHPRSQSKLGKLFSRAAENGIQLFIETHSDHILNGLRISVKNNEIDKDKIEVFYFSKDEKLLSKISNIKVQAKGGLTKWPDGFFDEWDNNLNKLL